jgi:hypothetical protein
VEELRLERDLLRQDEGPGVVVSAVYGLPGIGKSTLAAAVAQSRLVQERFADGVLWVTLGQNPELLSLAGQWIRDLGDHEFQALDLRSASGRLRQLLQERAVLLVVDDAWQSEHVEPFRVGGPRCRMLVTSRRAWIAEDLGALSHQLDVLSPGQALKLLGSRLGRPLGDEEGERARRLADAVGRLPLALELAGVRLGRGVSWDELLGSLDREVAALEALEDPRELRKGRAQLQASLNLSLRPLHAEDEAGWRCFVWLGVLPDDTTLAAPMASAMWEVEETEAEEVLECLWGEALLQPAAPVRVRGREWRAYRVHDLLHDCARRLLEAPSAPGRPEDLPGLGLTRAESQRQLLARYRKRTQAGQWHTLAVDGHIHGRLAWHLEQAGDAAGLHALLREETADGRNGWYEANERLGTPSAFADCVARAWRLADDAFLTKGSAPTLGLQCRSALVTASLNSLARNLPPALLTALVKQGQWTAEQALAYARRTPESRQKAEALATLVPFLVLDERAVVLGEALAAARAIGSEGPRSLGLAALAPHLPEPERAAVLAEALAAARASRPEGPRSLALAALAPHLPAGLLAEALAAARAIGGKWSRSLALAALAPRLPEPKRAAVLAEALAEARAIRDDEGRSEALAALAPHLPAGLLAEALAAARAIGGKWSRSHALAALAPRLPEPMRARVRAEALAAARASRSEGPRSLGLAALAPHLPEPERAAVLAEALAAARASRPEGPRSLALAALAPHLPAGLLAEALAAARAIGDDGGRSEALAALAPHLPEPDRAAVLADALAAARATAEGRSRSLTLAALAPHLPEPERAAVLAEALAEARTIEGKWARSEALAVLAPHLPAGLLAEALAAARVTGGKWARSLALAALGPHLPEPERAAVLAEALAEARAIGDDGSRSLALAALVSRLPDPEREAILAEILHAARASGDDWGRSRVLVALAPHLSAGLLAEALAAARATAEGRSRSLALAALAPHLPEPERAAVLAEALHAARAAGDDGGRSEALAALAPRLAGLTVPVLSSLWMETLPSLAAPTRAGLFANLRSMTLVLATLAGPDTPTEFREIARAISDVGRWWA